jgi:hypothetical protein
MWPFRERGLRVRNPPSSSDAFCHFEPLLDIAMSRHKLDEVNTGMPAVHELARGFCAVVMAGLDRVNELF